MPNPAHPDPTPSAGPQDDRAAEQDYVDGLFERLDAEVAAANERLRAVQANVDPANPKAEALVQREAEYHGLNERLDRLALAQLGLVFGRIDVADPEGTGDNPVAGRPGVDRRYIGRMGLDAREDNYRTLLLDWRAPAARPFYLATTAHPEGVRVRRHIRMRGREVTAVDDERLSYGPDDAAGVAAGPARADAAGPTDPDPDAASASTTRSGVGGEAALLAAMQAPRTGRMATIVETIQREQDRIIRDPSRGVSVVEGGPGTGKTAVALHRVAFLLYTWREQLARTGVLIVGPNRDFLDYISRVLPELGETGVVLTTVGELYPGVVPVTEEDALGREIKGSVEMATILRQAVRDLQALPDEPRRLRVGSLELRVDAAMVKKARTRARRSRKPHNEARPAFAEALVGQLAEQLAETIGADPLGGDNLLGRADVDQLHDDLAEEPAVRALIAELWPELTPTGVLAGLLSSPQAVASAARAYDEETREALVRADGAAWTASDAALLDELAELLGNTPQQPVGDASARDRRVEEAQAALDVLEGSAVTDTDDEQFDAEYLGAYDLLDAETLAERQEVRDPRSTAQRAAADRGWAYGHVVVDEAQELTPMEWRAVFRRCPARWMTLVGDPAQTGAPAGVDDWGEALAPLVGGRFRLHRLTVNYRTPAEISEFAAGILARIDPTATPPEPVRASGEPVRELPAGTDTEELAARLRQQDPHRSVAVVAPGEVERIKGLEFDHVIVDDPAGVVDSSPMGLQDLYVAVTRATQTLTLVGGL